MNRLFPGCADLPPQAQLPDPMIMLDGTAVTTPRQWFNSRRPELAQLFQHYMYGPTPSDPPAVVFRCKDDQPCLDGTAVLRQVALDFGSGDEAPSGQARAIDLMLVLPAGSGPFPVIVGSNRFGNWTCLNHPGIEFARNHRFRAAQKSGGLAAVQKDLESMRGNSEELWPFRQAVQRGYAMATFHCGDTALDDAACRPVRLPAAGRTVQTATIAAWAWGLSRCVDYLLTDGDIDARRICVFGHSRRGKAALLAAAFDERISVAFPHQAGCGGTAPSRRTNPLGESVTIINERFPHWFSDEFKLFGGHEDRLPFDQHCLIAMVAPRAVLLTCGQQDQWADPPGQFEMLKAADKVYRLLGIEGLSAGSPPPFDELLDSPLGYFIHDGPHETTSLYWKVFMDYADAQWRRKQVTVGSA